MNPQRSLQLVLIWEARIAEVIGLKIWFTGKTLLRNLKYYKPSACYLE
jgi:hypothetical protein